MHFLKKSLSQNFLIDKNIREKIINLIKIKKTDIIIEIGAGSGSISKDISNLAKKSHLIEIDTNLIQSLKKNINEKKSLIHNDDILKFNIKDVIKKYKKIRIIGNLPYKISTKIVMSLTKFAKNIKDIHIIIQKEMAEKIMLKCNNKKYGKISVIMQHYFEIKKILDIKANSFFPVPKVSSSLVVLKPKKIIHSSEDAILFKKMLNKSFNNRRKKILKSIKDLPTQDLQKEINKRPNNMSLDEFEKLHKKINSHTEDYKKI